MIERLNFYDLYGYLLPGLAFLGVLAFPAWVVTGWLPPAAWSSALVALVGGYLLGHALARPAQLAFPHGRLETGPGGLPVRRSPSDYLFDRLPEPVRNSVATAILDRFGLDVERRDQAITEDQEKALQARRSSAFLLCRRALLQKGLGSYAEQFEGLYSLMRAMTAVAVMASTYHAGWAAMLVAARFGPSTQHPTFQLCWMVLGVAVATLLGTTIWDYVREWASRHGQDGSPERDRSQLAAAAVAILAAGGLAAAGWAPPASANDRTLAVLIGAIPVSVWLAFRFANAYHAFSGQFAQTVYRDFFVLERYPPAPRAPVA